MRLLFLAALLFELSFPALARCPNPGPVSYSMGTQPSGDVDKIFCPVNGQPLDANLIGSSGCPAASFHYMNFSVDDPSLGIRLEYSCDANPQGQGPRSINGANCVDHSQYVRGVSIELAGPKAADYVLTYDCWSAAFNVCGHNIRHHGEKSAGQWCGDHFNSPSPWNRWWISRLNIYLRKK